MHAITAENSSSLAAILDDQGRAFGALEIDRHNIAVGTGGRFKAWFMTPGIINYEDVPGGGRELLKKETIDRALASLMGAPLTLGHISNKLTNFEEVANGKVDRVGFDADKGWHFCEGVVETENARNHIRDGWGVSVGSVVEEFGDPGLWLNDPYDKEITRLRFHHLALVPPGQKPRIDESAIRLNSTKPKMSFLKLFRSKAAANGAAATVETVEVSQNARFDLGGGVTASAEELAAAGKVARDNAIHAVGHDDFFECDGVRYNCGDAMKALKEKHAMGQHRPNSAVETPKQKAAREVVEASDSVAAAFAKVGETKVAADRPNATDAEKAAHVAAKTAHEEALASAEDAVDRFNSAVSIAPAVDELAVARENTAAAEARAAAAERETKLAKAQAEAERVNATRRAGLEHFTSLAGAGERGSVAKYAPPSSGLARGLARGRRLMGSDQKAAASKN